MGFFFFFLSPWKSESQEGGKIDGGRTTSMVRSFIFYTPESESDQRGIRCIIPLFT